MTSIYCKNIVYKKKKLFFDKLWSSAHCSQSLLHMLYCETLERYSYLFKKWKNGLSLLYRTSFIVVLLIVIADINQFEYCTHIISNEEELLRDMIEESLTKEHRKDLLKEKMSLTGLLLKK